MSLLRAAPLLLLASCTPPSHATPPSPAPTQADGGTSAGPPVALHPPRPFIRFFKPADGSYLLTTTEKEKDDLLRTGWQLQDPVGELYSSSADAAGLVPVHSLYNAATQDRNYTVHSNEVTGATAAGYVSQIAGYAFDKAVAGAVPVYRARNTATGKHYFTTNEAEYQSLGSAWTRDVVSFYVPTPFGTPAPLKLYSYPNNTPLPNGDQYNGPLTFTESQILGPAPVTGVINGPDGGAQQEVLQGSFPTIASLDGILLTVAWNQLCPTSATACDFTLIDAALQYWHALRKKVVLCVATEGYPYVVETNPPPSCVNAAGVASPAPCYANETPQWVLDAMGPAGTYTIPTNREDKSAGHALGVIKGQGFPVYNTYPKVWLPKFTPLVQALATQLAGRYAHNPAIEAIRIPYGILGEDNPPLQVPVLLDTSASSPGLTYETWIAYLESTTQIFQKAFSGADVKLEADISFVPWIYAKVNDPTYPKPSVDGGDPIASIEGAANDFVDCLIDISPSPACLDSSLNHHVIVGYNGYEAGSLAAINALKGLDDIPLPSAATYHASAAAAIQDVAMHYLMRAKGYGSPIEVEGVWLNDAKCTSEMADPGSCPGTFKDLAAGINGASGPFGVGVNADRMDVWGWDLSHESSGLSSLIGLIQAR